MLPSDPKARKNIPVYSGFIKYFPRAICAVAELSRIGNDQHSPGEPLHWDKEKSKDEADALMRHMLDHVMGPEHDTDGVHHLTKLAWRAMAQLERALDAEDILQSNLAAAEVRLAEFAREPDMTATEVIGRYKEHFNKSVSRHW